PRREIHRIAEHGVVVRGASVNSQLSNPMICPSLRRQGVLPLGPTLLATIHVLLDQFTSQPDRVLCHSGTRSIDSRRWIHVVLLQMAAHSSCRPVVPGFRKAKIGKVLGAQRSDYGAGRIVEIKMIN